MSFNAEREVMRSIVHLSRRKEFYGHVVQQFEKVHVDGPKHFVQTAAVGKMTGERLIKLYVHNGYFKKMFKSKDDGWKYVESAIEHEILHIVFNHLFQKFDDKVRGGIAVDCVVNGFISDEKRFKGWIHPTDYDFEVGKSSMWYYVNLKNNKKFQDQLKDGSFGPGGQLEWMMGSHKAWESVTEDGFLKELCKDIVRKSRDLCAGNYGDIPGKVIQQIDKILKTKKEILPWSRILRLFCAGASESVLDYTMKRKSRRFGTRPGTRKADVLNLAVIVDTSGSIFNSQLVMFFNEIYHIWKNGAQVVIYEADTDVERWYKYRGKWKGEVHGRGGTDLEPALKAVEGNFDAAIYFTDFYAPTIDTRYRIPILWVLSTVLPKSEYPYPWGKHVVIDDGSNHWEN